MKIKKKIIGIIIVILFFGIAVTALFLKMHSKDKKKGLDHISNSAIVQTPLPERNKEKGDETSMGTSQGTSQGTSLEASLAAWVIYWETEDIAKEVSMLWNKLDSICNFGACFDEAYDFYIPEKTREIEKQYLKADGGPIKYLTVVNDVVKDNGKNSLKDTAILEKFFKDTSSMDNHIENLIALLKQEGYKALEIDYEQITEKSLAMKYSTFLSRLWERLKEEDMRLRVALEPRFPYSKVTLPEGPEYVIMFYNLHYGSSAPGPKADDTFIRELCADVKKSVSSFQSAFATGGFDWGEKSFTSLNEKQCMEIAEAENIKPQRDSQSQALSYTYMMNGEKHEVWFADGVTIKHWITVAKECGSKGISLWKLSGNREESLRVLMGAEEERNNE